MTFYTFSVTINYMYRKIYEALKQWKESSNRKPLILQGARQVGKTYIVNYFATKEYKNYVYINFEQDNYMEEAFKDLHPENIVKSISVFCKKQILKHDTLIIFDEIQFSKKALTSLKYFNEEANDYHIIALGSLLGVALNREEYSFPVGKVNFLEMSSMDFEEFLIALGENELIEKIKICYTNNEPIDNVYHNTLISFYKDYLYIGGMPSCLNEFVQNKNVYMVRLKQKEIEDCYISDMSKYNTKIDIEKTRAVYLKLPTILYKENIKFKYSEIKKEAKSRNYEHATNWIDLSGIAKKVYKVNDIKLPLNAYMDNSSFKFYMNDMGLLFTIGNISYDDILYSNDLMNEYKGGVAENYVYLQLKNKYKDIFYYRDKYDCEIDFITRINGDIIPIEVKSSVNTRSKSLLSYIKKYNPKYSIRVSLKNFGFENGIKSVPLYAAFCI